MSDRTDSLSDRSKRPDFADWTEAWCNGYNAARAGVPDDDPEAFFRAMREGFANSGSERARRFLERGDPEEIATSLAALGVEG